MGRGGRAFYYTYIYIHSANTRKRAHGRASAVLQSLSRVQYYSCQSSADNLTYREIPEAEAGCLC